MSTFKVNVYFKNFIKNEHGEDYIMTDGIFNKLKDAEGMFDKYAKRNDVSNMFITETRLIKSLREVIDNE